MPASFPSITGRSRDARFRRRCASWRWQSPRGDMWSGWERAAGAKCWLLEPLMSICPPPRRFKGNEVGVFPQSFSSRVSEETSRKHFVRQLQNFRVFSTSFRLNLRSPKAFRTWRVNSSTPNARELTDDGGGQMGAAPLDPGERSVNSGVLVAAVAGLGDPEPLPKSAGT